MFALVWIALLCQPGEANDLDRRIDQFRSYIDDPVRDTFSMCSERGADRIDLVPAQRKDLVELWHKHMKRREVIRKKLVEKYAHLIDLIDGRMHARTVEESEQWEQFEHEYAKASEPILDEWRKEMANVLTRQQVIRFNEAKWRSIGAAKLLYYPRFQRILGLDKQQIATLDEIHSWSVESPPLIGMVGEGLLLDDDHPFRVARLAEAKEKAMKVLRDDQLDILDRLLGKKKREPAQPAPRGKQGK